MNFNSILNKIKYDVSKGSLEEITYILDNYQNSGEYYINPLLAACINERYFNLTGNNHSGFIKKQEEELDRLIKSNDNLNIDNELSIYKKLQNNLRGNKPGIKIITDTKNNYKEIFDRIKYDMSEAKVEELDEILNNYGNESYLINGEEVHYKINELYGACLNASYKRLTGNDHPKFMEIQNKRIKEKIKENKMTVKGENIYQDMKKGDIEIADKNHPLTKLYQVLGRLSEAKLEDVSALLDYYNAKPVLINGMIVHSYNDPFTALKLNNRFRELTNQNHPRFLTEVPNVIDDILKNKDIYIEKGVYDYNYVTQLEALKRSIIGTVEEKNNIR